MTKVRNPNEIQFPIEIHSIEDYNKHEKRLEKQGYKWVETQVQVRFKDQFVLIYPYFIRRLYNIDDMDFKVVYWSRIPIKQTIFKH